MKKTLLSIFFISVFVLPAGAQTVNSITAEQAIEIAKQEAIDQGRSPDWFINEGSAEFDGEKWRIFFTGNPEPEDGSYTRGNEFAATVSQDGTEIVINPSY